MMDQMIVAVRQDKLPNSLKRSGFHPFDEPGMFTQLTHAGIWIGPRQLLEEDETFQQLIPYIVLSRGDAIACYQREESGSEGRLHGLKSIGIGGHVEFIDVAFNGTRIDPRATVEAAAHREVREEVGDLHILTQRWRGLLVDHDSPVGRVHLGLVGVWGIANATIVGSEQAIGSAMMVRAAELETDRTAFESWSSILLDVLPNILVDEKS